MGKENSDSKKRILLMILAPLFCTVAGISLLIGGIEDKDKPVIVIAIFMLVLDVVMSAGFLIDWIRKR